MCLKCGNRRDFRESGKIGEKWGKGGNYHPQPLQPIMPDDISETIIILPFKSIFDSSSIYDIASDYESSREITLIHALIGVESIGLILAYIFPPTTGNNFYVTGKCNHSWRAQLHTRSAQEVPACALYNCRLVSLRY